MLAGCMGQYLANGQGETWPREAAGEVPLGGSPAVPAAQGATGMLKVPATMVVSSLNDPSQYLIRA